MELLIEKRRRRCYVWCAYLLSGLFFDHTYVLARKIGAVHREVTDGEQANALQVSDGTSLVHGNNVPTEVLPKKEGNQNLALLIALGIVGSVGIYMMFQKLTSNSVEDELKEAAKTLDEAEGKYNKMKEVLTTEANTATADNFQTQREDCKKWITRLRKDSGQKKEAITQRVQSVQNEISEEIAAYKGRYPNVTIKTGSRKKAEEAKKSWKSVKYTDRSSFTRSLVGTCSAERV